MAVAVPEADTRLDVFEGALATVVLAVAFLAAVAGLATLLAGDLAAAFLAGAAATRVAVFVALAVRPTGALTRAAPVAAAASVRRG